MTRFYQAKGRRNAFVRDDDGFVVIVQRNGLEKPFLGSFDHWRSEYQEMTPDAAMARLEHTVERLRRCPGWQKLIAA